MPPRLSGEDCEQVLIRMTPDMHRALKEAAADEERTMAQQVRLLVRHYLESREGA